MCRYDEGVLSDLEETGSRIISEELGVKKAKTIGAVEYIECSAKTQHNIKQVFDRAIHVGIKYAEKTLNT